MTNEDRVHRLALTGGLSAILLLLSGCSQAGDSNSARDEWQDVSIDGRDSIVAQLDFESGIARLPLDQYSAQDPRFVGRAHGAIETLTQRCMTESGFPGVANVDEIVPEENRSFGQWSVTKAAAFGTELAPNTGRAEPDTVNHGVEYNNALIPCMTNAKETLMTELTYAQSANIDARIAQGAHDLSVRSAEGKQAFEDRALCVEAKGVVMAPSRLVMSDQYYKQEQDVQIRTATAFAECSVSTGAVQTLFDLMARYQTVMIEQSAGALSEHQKKLAEISARFDAIISGAEVPK